MSLVQAMSVSVPLLFGAIGSSLGLLPVFWTVGVGLAAGGLMTRRPSHPAGQPGNERLRRDA